MVLRKFFLIFSNADILFTKQKLTLRSCIVTKALPTLKQVEIIYKKKIAKMTFDENIKVFLVHIIFFSLNSILIHLAQKTQIALLLAKEIKIPNK